MEWPVSIDLLELFDRCAAFWRDQRCECCRELNGSTRPAGYRWERDMGEDRAPEVKAACYPCLRRKIDNMHCHVKGEPGEGPVRYRYARLSWWGRRSGIWRRRCG